MEVNRPPLASSETRRKWTQAVIIVIGVFTFACYLLLHPLASMLLKNDQAGAVQRVETGTIEQIVPAHRPVNSPLSGNAERDRWIPALVSVRVHGQLATTEHVTGSSELHIGRAAQVTFRIGKSGRVYVDQVEPIANTGRQ